MNFPQRGGGRVELDASALPSARDEAFGRVVRRCRRAARVDIVGEISEADRPAVVALAAAGAPLHRSTGRWGDREGRVTDVLGEPLSVAVTEPVQPGDRGRELHSVRVRRAALDLLSGAEEPPYVSVLLATMRPTDLRSAIAQARAQRGCRAQLVIGLHGDHWRDHDAVDPELLTDRDVVRRFDASWSLGGVLRALTEHADADIVTKWDDDDWYGRDHVADLVRAMRYSGADVVGKAAEFVRLDASDVTIRRFAIGAESYTSTLAGGAMSTTRGWLHAIGGWPDVARGVDRAVIDATQRAGGRLYRTHGFQYVLRRRPHSHTWSAPDAHFLAVADEVRPGLDLAFADVDPVDD